MITFIGSGILSYRQLTLEGLEALKEASEILTFQKNDEFFIQHHLKTPIDLKSLYLDSAKDADNYSRIASAVLEAEKNHGNVAVLLPGHPRLGVTLVQLFKGHPNLRVIAGISSFCTMINDLQIDPLERGTALLDANRYLLFELEIDPQVNHLLYHVCSVGTARTHWSDPSKDNALELLENRLISTFGADHEVYLLSSKTSEGSSSRQICVRLAELCSRLSCIDFDTSLFVPAIKPKRINRKFLARLTG